MRQSLTAHSNATPAPMQKVRLGLVAALVLVTVASYGQDKKRNPWNVGELAAAVVSSAKDQLNKAQLVSAMKSAKVVAGKDALRLLPAETTHKVVQRAKSTLAQRNAIGVLLMVTGSNDKYLFVPESDGKNRSGIGLLLPEGEQQQCSHCDQGGERGGSCTCATVCFPQPCPNTSSGHCGQCSEDLATWTPDFLWSDPMPPEFQVVKNLFGEDRRFKCAVAVENLKPGEKLFDRCQ